MKVDYKRDLQNNYMILEASEAEGDDGYCLRMAEQNEIAGLLPFHSSRKDGTLYLHYEITSKQSIENLYARNTLKYQDILFLLKGIADTLENLQKYLLSPVQLLFDPRFIYTCPDRSRIFLCYLPGENEYSITALAEFILKRLDHEDKQAVALGYQFYQTSLEENFSLQKTLREILLLREENQYDRSDNDRAGNKNQQEAGRKENGRNGSEGFENGRIGNERTGDKRIGGKRNEDIRNEGKRNGEKRNEEKRNEIERYGDERSKSAWSGDVWSEYEKSGKDKLEYKKFEDEKHEKVSGDYRDIEEYEVTHKVRKKKSAFKKAADWLFERVHPAVFLSLLFLLAVLEIVFFLGWISLTEAGGVFFLLISVEILINKYWRNRKDRGNRQEEWWEEEPEEEYRRLQKEMYEEQESEAQEKAIEETRCLVPNSMQEGLRLICLHGVSRNYDGRQNFQDIFVEKEILYVGKIAGESDVLLDTPTVSRMHARLERKAGKYYVKDLNSRNGTFVNGERLKPQEQCEITVGDRVAFAEVEYQAVRL